MNELNNSAAGSEQNTRAIVVQNEFKLRLNEAVYNSDVLVSVKLYHVVNQFRKRFGYDVLGRVETKRLDKIVNDLVYSLNGSDQDEYREIYEGLALKRSKLMENDSDVQGLFDLQYDFALLENELQQKHMDQIKVQMCTDAGQYNREVTKLLKRTQPVLDELRLAVNTIIANLDHTKLPVCDIYISNDFGAPLRPSDLGKPTSTADLEKIKVLSVPTVMLRVEKDAFHEAFIRISDRVEESGGDMYNHNRWIAESDVSFLVNGSGAGITAIGDSMDLFKADSRLFAQDKTIRRENDGLGL